MEKLELNFLIAFTNEDIKIKNIDSEKKNKRIKQKIIQYYIILIIYGLCM